MRRLALLVWIAACAPQLPPQATALDAERANVDLGELQQGRKLLLAKCASCHKAPLPKDHAPGEWPKYVADMAPRSKLDTTQRALIERYLVVMAEAP